MKFIKGILLLLILTVFVQAKSQKQWTLQDCIEHAYEHNAQLKQSELSVKVQEFNMKQAKYDILPNLNGGADYKMNFGRSVDPYTYQFTNNNIKSSNLYLSSSLDLFAGGRNYHAIQKNKYNLLASIQEHEKFKNDFALNIATAYLQILFNQELLKAAQRRLEQSKEQELFTQKLVKAGTLPEGDLYNTAAQTANDNLQLINAQNQLDNAKLLLTQLIDYNDSLPFDILPPKVDDIDTLLLYSPDEIFEKAKNLPRMQAQQNKQLAYEQDVALARSRYYPTLTLSASYATGYSDARKQYTPGDTLTVPVGFTESLEPVYMYQNTYNEEDYPFSNQFTDNASTSISLRLSVPIFNKFSTNTAVQLAKISVQNQSLSIYTTEQNLYKDIQEAYLNAKAASAGFNSSKQAVLANKTAFEYAQKKFKVGLITFNDYQSAKNGYLIAESEYVRSKYEFLFRKSILDFYAEGRFSIK